VCCHTEADVDKRVRARSGRRAVDGASAGHRTGEGNVADVGVLHELRDLCVVGVHRLRVAMVAVPGGGGNEIGGVDELNATCDGVTLDQHFDDR
jgi:hypothetical protein